MRSLLLLLPALLLAGCTSTRPAAPPAASPAAAVVPEAASVEDAYAAAVADAAVVYAHEIVDTLRPVRRDTPGLPWRGEGDTARVQVVTWTRFLPASDTLEVGAWQMWVTLPPEVQTACRGADDPAMRARQVLGLPPDASNTHFVAWWVRPDDLFRPCWDPEIDDTTCRFERSDAAGPAHVEWMDAQTWTAFSRLHDDDRVYPWTRLGYTYDWGGRSPVGVSEYVVRPGSLLLLAGPAVPTSEYCAP